MPITSSAKKALRSSLKKRRVNQPYRNKMRSLIKELRKTPTAKNLPTLFSILDRAAKKQVIHKKKADRLKSRLTLLVNKEKTKTKKSPKNS